LNQVHLANNIYKFRLPTCIPTAFAKAVFFEIDHRLDSKDEYEVPLIQKLQRASESDWQIRSPRPFTAIVVLELLDVIGVPL
jgi:hypothetical protein